jgi:hypothetical protein
MGTHEAVLAEIAGALAILGLLLVFLPLLLQAVAAAGGGHESQKARRTRKAWAWAAPGLIVLASADATVGLFALWGKWATADLTGWLLVLLVWLIAALAVVTVARGVR